MTARKQIQAGEPVDEGTAQTQDCTAQARKPFVEPAISSPIDVLAATTFFQVVDSGSTLRRPSRSGGTD
jgi:hypothetical protein